MKKSELDELLGSLPPQLRAEIEKQINEYFRDFKTASDKDRIAALKEIVKTIDDDIEAIPDVLKNTFSCKKGCNFCCRMNVSIFEWEAELIALYCQENNIIIDKEYLLEQLKYSPEEIGFSPSHAACVFLKNGECSIYPVRPIMCKKYFVFSDPQFCNLMEHPKMKVPIYADLSLEVFILAVDLFTGKEAERMPKQLLPYAK